MLAGTLLFIAGFTVVFVATAILFSGVGKLFFRYERTLEIVIGALVVVLGLGYLGVIPGMQREFRIRWLPSAGLLGAPVLGAVFALSWLPCTGPTLGAVLGMAATEGGTDRAVVLAVAYCLGLGIPFVVFGLGFQRAARGVPRRPAQQPLGHPDRRGPADRDRPGADHRRLGERGDLVADERGRGRGEHLMTTVDDRPSTPPAQAPRGGSTRCWPCCATRGGSSPACVPR